MSEQLLSRILVFVYNYAMLNYKNMKIKFLENRRLCCYSAQAYKINKQLMPMLSIRKEINVFIFILATCSARELINYK